MLKMSFFDGTLNKEKAKEYILNSGKPCRYTYKLGYRSNSTTNNIFITKEEALEIIAKESLLDLREHDTYIHLNAYSSNDMW